MDVELQRMMSDMEAIEAQQAHLDTKILEYLRVLADPKGRDTSTLVASIASLNQEEKRLEEMWVSRRQNLMSMKHKMRTQIATDSRRWDEESMLLAFSSLRMSTAPPRSRDGSPGNSGGNTAASPSLASSQASVEDAEMSKWEIDPKDIVPNKNALLGAGAFGSVYAGTLHGKEVAIKRLQQQDIEEKVLEEFRKEVMVMVKLRHPHLLLFMGACTSPGNLAMVTELMPRGSVMDMLRGPKKMNLSFKRAMLFALDTAQGMNWLHCMRPPILHLDLKTANLLVDANWVVKVADFGLSTVKKASNTGQAGSPLYMAPEMMLNKSYDEKCDVYSFGIVLWELYVRKEPFEGEFTTFPQLAEGVVRQQKRPRLPDNTPPLLRNLIVSCWAPLPKDRPSFSDILASHSIENIILEGVISQPNELGRRFWSQSFPGRWTVSYPEFLTAFMVFLGISFSKYNAEDIHWQCLRAVLLKDKEEAVTVEEFGKMLEWFGPLDKGYQIVDSIYSICIGIKGFFGDVSSEEASKILSGKDKGTYVLRFSVSEPGCYALTVMNKEKQLQQFKILHRAGQGYTLLHHKAALLPDLLKQVAKEMKLKKSAEGSRFQQMETAFLKKTQSVAGYSAQY